jgi:hypothetical protein
MPDLVDLLHPVLLDAVLAVLDESPSGAGSEVDERVPTITRRDAGDRGDAPWSPNSSAASSAVPTVPSPARSHSQRGSGGMRHGGRHVVAGGVLAGTVSQDPV